MPARSILIPLPWWEGIKGRGITPTFTLLNPCFAGFAEGEIQQGESSPLRGRR